MYQKGDKIKLIPQVKDDHYVASFTPESAGVYSIVLDHKKYQVLDYTAYDYGIFRPQYQSITKVLVGDSVAEKTVSENHNSITIVNHYLDTYQAKLQVLFKGAPLPDTEVTVFMEDDWSKKMKTDKEGMIEFKLPLKGRYVIEATHEDKEPGVFNGKDYEFTWHCAVYTIN